MSLEQALFRFALAFVLGTVLAVVCLVREARLRLTLHARYVYGVERKPGESDRSLRARCLARMKDLEQ